MLKEGILNVVSHGVKINKKPFFSCHLNGGDKVRIPGNKNDFINGMFGSHRCNV